ncbi:hypothetical protein MHTCC0001_26110 [Flavobacteriaceae bacterium MHTCC 0001]
MTQQDIKEGTKYATISYLTIIGVIVAHYLNEKKNPFIAFHVRQSLGLWLTLIVINLSIVSNFDIFMLRVSVYVFFITLWFYGFLGALSGKLNLVPLLGKLYQKIFSNLGT